jgi:hypothetical protein
VDRERRQALLGVKLAALVRDRWGDGPRRPVPFPGGAALRGDGDSSTGWVLVDERPTRALGGAMAWAWRQGVVELHVVVDEAAGGLARRARLFSTPPSIWLVEGRALREAAPDAIPAETASALELAVYQDLIRTAGAEAVVEHGIVRGEVLGLEVALVEDGRLMVGVGKHDREAHAMANPDRPAADALAVAVDAVRTFRRADAGAHPANQLSVERWLRAAVIARPDMVGLPADAELAPVSSPVVRDDLRQAAPAPALGAGALVVCSVGIDTDLVPAAADAWAANGRAPRLMIVVPEGDDPPVTRALAALLAHPADVVTVPRSWRRVLDAPVA